MSCPLCQAVGEIVLWRDQQCRVIAVPQPGYCGYCRVIWHEHVREMSDLAVALREALHPAKINLASLGNQVPHLHWHVIPRFEDDPHFPDAIWASPRRSGQEHTVDQDALAAELRRRLAAL